MTKKIKTYDVAISLLPLMVEGIKERFESVEVVDRTNGQSIESMRGSFPYLVEQVIDANQKNALAKVLDGVASSIRRTGFLQHHLPADELSRLHEASTLIESIRATTEKWKLT